MVDIVIPIGRLSCQRTDLIWMLRSLEKYGTGIGELFIIGDRPTYLKEFNHISFSEHWSRDENMMRKIMHACKQENISDPFFYAHDDHFFLQPFDLTTYPDYYYGTTDRAYANSRAGAYQRVLNNTWALQNALKQPKIFYNVHAPILIHKEQFRAMYYHVDKLPEAQRFKGRGWCFKTIYRNSFEGANDVEMKDLKIKDNIRSVDGIKKLIEGAPLFSTGEHAMNKEMEELIGELYDTKSRWEL